MSLPKYGDFDKNARDLFSDDFDTACIIKVKYAAPYGVSLTTTTDMCALTSEAAFKWAHASGFAVDKLEITGCNKVKLETSLTGLAPGLKLDVEGAIASSGNLGVTYKHQLATVTTNLDIVDFSSLSATVLGGSNGVLAGASVNCNLAGKFDVKDFSAALAYNPNDSIFVGVGANKKFSEFNASLKCNVKPTIAVAALIDVVPKNSSHKFNIGAEYACNPNTTLKFKVNNDGMICASAKQQLPNKLSMVGAVEFDTRDASSINFGVTSTLG